jgi:hypothetical protein|tara:strand:- start:54 stop:314 length:261 start_codon:yes stop_codon:yes gene_type:complete
MSLTKETIVDKIEVLEDGSVQVRTATRVLEDGVVLSSSFHRHVCAPDCDTTGEDPKVVAICAAVHTPEVIAAFAAAQAAAANAIGE